MVYLSTLQNLSSFPNHLIFETSKKRKYYAVSSAARQFWQLGLLSVQKMHMCLQPVTSLFAVWVIEIRNHIFILPTSFPLPPIQLHSLPLLVVQVMVTSPHGRVKERCYVLYRLFFQIGAGYPCKIYDSISDVPVTGAQIWLSSVVVTCFRSVMDSFVYII